MTMSLTFSIAKIVALSLVAITTDAMRPYDTKFGGSTPISSSYRNAFEVLKSQVPQGRQGTSRYRPDPIALPRNTQDMAGTQQLHSNRNEPLYLEEANEKPEFNMFGCSLLPYDDVGMQRFGILFVCVLLSLSCGTLLVNLGLKFNAYLGICGYSVLSFGLFWLLSYLGDIGMRKLDTKSHWTNVSLNGAGVASLTGMITTGTGIVWQACSTVYDGKMFDNNYYADAAELRQHHNEYLKERLQSLHDAGYDINPDVYMNANLPLGESQTKDFLQNEIDEHLGVVDSTLLVAFFVFIGLFVCLYAAKFAAWKSVCRK